jgi:hypothetical protein
MVRIQREDLALRVALFDLNGNQRLFDFPFEADVPGLEADGVLAPAGRDGRPAAMSFIP